MAASADRAACSPQIPLLAIEDGLKLRGKAYVYTVLLLALPLFLAPLTSGIELHAPDATDRFFFEQPVNRT